MAAEELLLYGAGPALKRRLVGMLFLGLLRLQNGLNGGEIFAGGLGIAHERSAKYRLDAGRTNGDCLQRNLPLGLAIDPAFADSIAPFPPLRHHQEK